MEKYTCPNVHILGSCGQVFAIRTEANTSDVNIPFCAWEYRIGERTALVNKTIKDAGNPWVERLPYLNTHLDVVDIDSFVTSRSYTITVRWKMNRTDDTGWEIVRQAGAWERERNLGWEMDRIKSTSRFWTNLGLKLATQLLYSLRHPGGTLNPARSLHHEGASEGFFSLLPLEDGDGAGSDWIVDDPWS